MVGFPKPSKGARLRTKKATAAKASRELSDLYRKVYLRDGYRCVVCVRVVIPGAVDELRRAHPHHIVFRSQATKAEKHTTKNVCTVCAICHADIHERRLFITGNADTKLVIRKLAAAQDR